MSFSGPMQAYVVAVVVTTAALALRIALSPLFATRVPYATFYPAVAFAAMFGGLGPGLVATALSSAGAVIWILPALSRTTVSEVTGLAVFATMGMVISITSGLYRRSRQRVAQYEKYLAVRESEEARRESEERLRVAFAASPDAININRLRDGAYVYVNERFEQVSLWPRADVIGKTAIDLNVWVDLERRKRLMAQLLSGHDVQHVETEFRRRDGSVFVAAISARTFVANGERFLLAITRDISELKRAEEALRRTQSILQYAGAMARLGAWWIEIADPKDLNSNPLRWSDEVYRLFGYEPGGVEVSNALFFEHVHPEDRQRVGEAVAQALATRGTYRVEHRIVQRGGTERVVLEHGSFEFDNTGLPVRLVGAVQDVTERKRSEDSLREADRRKDEFLGMLSHELRNPLGPIRNSTYILQHADPGSEQARRAQTVIQRQTEHLTRLVDDLLDVTRIARGKIELRRSCVDLRDVVWRAGEDFRLLMRDRGVRYDVQIPDGELWADADATRITQVIGNLLLNAAKFTREGDEVSLSVEADKREATIRVRDTGVGIAPELLPRIFAPFVQGERTLARTDGGLGLGLALVKGLAELHGGTVRADSAGEGKGSEFIVRLPLAPAAEKESRPVQHSERQSSRRRVLVIDDNADAAESLADIVRMLGHSAEVAYDGPTAIEKARANVPNIVLCDIGLPGMSGYEVAKALRVPPLEGVQLIAVSGYAQPEDVKRAIEAGFDGHVAKPCDPEKIERLLG